MDLRFARVLLGLFVVSFVLSCASPSPRPDPATAAALNQILASQHRSINAARDIYLHPKETLQFFGIRRDMTVIEAWPQTGWHTEILAPLLRDKGLLYAAQMDPIASAYVRSVTDAYQQKLSARPDLYDKVIVTKLGVLGSDGQSPPIVPPASADAALTFDDLHTWMMSGWEQQALSALRQALKPGGVLGVVDHRGDAKVPQDPKAASGYVNEQYAIDMIENAGFKLVGRSEINANPRDFKNYDQGVWTLPPTYALGEKDRARYAAIGESDRFTLKFIKVDR